MENVLKERFGEEWYEVLEQHINSPSFDALGKFLKEERARKQFIQNHRIILEHLK